MAIDCLIREARFPDDTETLRELFREYAEWLGIRLDFQDFEAELASLPGKYAPPEGGALIAETSTGMVLGCVAMRPLGDGVCEMKRLFLRADSRGSGLGRALAENIIRIARDAGHSRIVLDTLRHMQSALHLYENLGFSPIDAYYPNPIPTVVYMGRDLTQS